MAFPPAFIDDLISRNPIEEVVGEYVSLTRKGGNLFGLCPFHGEKTASFSVAPEKQIYYCFGCHRGGGVINFIMEQENLSYPDAVRHLAKRVGLEVPEDEAYRSRYKAQERLWNLSKEAARYFHSQLMGEAGAEARAYLVKRGMSSKIVTKFGLGFAPQGWSNLIDAMRAKGYTKEELLEAGLVSKSEQKGSIYDRFRNRLMFPIIDLRGNVIGFGGRVMDDSTPKYLNSPETSIFNKRKNLFALNLAKKSKQEYIILTEGYMDAITLYQYGFDCAVASLGTALTQEHAAMLAKYTNQVVLTYDADQAGQNATKRAIPLLEKTGLKVRVLRMQGAKDPDEFLKKYGADRFKLLLEQSANHIEYRLTSLQHKYDLHVDDQRIAFLHEAADLVASLNSAVEREVYGTRAAEAAGITAEAMKLEIKKSFNKRMARERAQQKKKDLAPAAQQQPVDRSIRYENMRSAMAEEGVLRMLVREPALFSQLGGLTSQMFSVPLLGRAYDALREQYQQGLQVTMAGLGEAFTAQETAHLTRVAQKTDSLVSEEAFLDYCSTIMHEYEKSGAQSPQALLAMRDRMKDKKGYGG